MSDIAPKWYARVTDTLMGLGSLAVGAYAIAILVQAFRVPAQGQGGLTSVPGALTFGSFVIFLACVVSYYVWRKRQATLRMLEEKIRALEARIEEQEKRRAAAATGKPTN